MRATVPSMNRRRFHWYSFLLMASSLTLFMFSLFLRRSAVYSTSIDDAVALPTTKVVKANNDINRINRTHHRQSKPHHSGLQADLVTTALENSSVPASGGRANNTDRPIYITIALVVGMVLVTGNQQHGFVGLVLTKIGRSDIHLIL